MGLEDEDREHTAPTYSNGLKLYLFFPHFFTRTFALVYGIHRRNELNDR